MSKPLSRPNELGRAIGYKVDINLVLDRLKGVSGRDWERLRTDRVFVEQMERAAQIHQRSATYPTMPAKELKRLWVVVKSENGVPVMMDAYPDKRSARRREKFLRQHMRADMDEVTLFDVNLKSDS